jgi:hypothetical protein
MKLNSLMLRNFRSIKDARFEFPVRCQVLVGINETGKTNLLDALALLDPESEVAQSDARLPGKKEPPLKESYVRFVFTLEKEDHAAVASMVAPLVLTPSDSTPFLIRNGQQVSVRDAIQALGEGLYIVDILEKKRYGSYWAAPRRVLHQLMAGFSLGLMDHPPRS